MAGPRPQIITEANATSPQIIDGSARFIREQKTHLKRTPSSASNRKTWTLSFWVKMGAFNIRESDGTWNRGAFLSSGSNPWGGPTIWSDATTRHFAHAHDPSGTDYSKRCISNCRDFSSWYHVVYTTDTTQSTDTNRWKIYVNGELQDLETPSGLNGYPAQNAELGINNAVQHYLGTFLDSSAYFDGYISEYHFLDGQVVGPENFGYRDTLTNTWRPKKYTGAALPNTPSKIFSANYAASDSFQAAANKYAAFDGSITSRSACSSSGCTVTVSSMAVIVNSKLEVYAGYGSASVNGGTAVSFSGSAPGWQNLSFTGTLNTLAVTGDNTSNPNAGEIYAIRVDGVILVDGGGYGINGFYLPFDGKTSIGEDKSGRGNNWSPVNFSSNITSSSGAACGPILNTINGGNVASVGVAGRAGVAVTVYNSGSGNKYYLDGVEAGTLSFVPGQHITFDTSDSTVSGHPFRFATAADAAGSTQYTTGSVTGASEGSAGAATTIILPHNAPSNLYYYCTNHSGMGGTLDIGDIDTSVADPYALDCYFALPLLGGNPEDVSHQVNWQAAKKTASTASNLAVSQRSVLYNNSTYFNGSSSEIKYSVASELDFASKDFTVEMWFYTRNLTGEHHYPLIQKGNASNNNNYDWRLYFSGTGTDEYIWWDTAGGGPSMTGPVVEETYKWYHVAVCKDSTNIRMYFNGEQKVTASWSGGDVDDAYTEICLGHANHGGAGDTWLDGEISDARIYVGRAKYTSDFTPDSSKLPAIVKDTPSGVLYSSELEKPEYGAVTFGQEAGYMTVPENADWDFGTGDYTAEAWVYMTGTDNYVFSTLSSLWWGVNFWTNNSSWTIRCGQNNGSSSKHEVSKRWNYRRWYHIAVARESGTSRLFLDGELIDTQSDTNNLDSTGALQIGRDPQGWNKKFSGLISNARIVKGTAVYTHSFVPSRKPLTNITNTKLLCCQSKTSATAYAVSPGTITAQTSDTIASSFNPFEDNIDLVRGQKTGYCTLTNGFWDTGGDYSFYEGNLVLGKVADGGWDAVFGTVSFPPTGKWQWEFSPEPKGGGQYPYNVKIGWMPESKTHSMTQNQMGTAGVLVYDVHTGGACKYQLDTGSQTSYGAAIQTPGAVITLGLDFDNKVAKFALDGVARAELDISSSSLLTSGNLIPCLIGYYGDSVHFWKFNFGQKPFTFSFGEDYKTICLANSEEPALARPDKYFTTFAYNGSSATTFRKLGLEADLVWIKSNYDNTGGWNCLDTVRGASQTVQLNTNAAQTNETGNFVSFDKEGVTVTGSANAWNGIGDKFVIYAWAAGGSKGTFNKDGNAYSTAATAGLTAGDITPTGCSINTKTGFSIIQYTAAGNGDRVPHGLTQTPDFLITKVVSSPSDDWSVYTTVVDGSYDYFVLNGTNAKTDSGQTAFNATTFPNVWGSGKTVINYAWHNVPGVQKFGLCYGNNDADGPPVYLGFEPAMIILKEASQTSAWTTKCNNAFDNVYATTLNHKYTGTYNPVGNQMYLNTTAIDEAKSAAYGKVDFLSNGFRARVAGQSVNSNTSYIFMAFAAKPYHNLYGGDANAR